MCDSICQVASGRMHAVNKNDEEMEIGLIGNG